MAGGYVLDRSTATRSFSAPSPYMISLYCLERHTIRWACSPVSWFPNRQPSTSSVMRGSCRLVCSLATNIMQPRLIRHATALPVVRAVRQRSVVDGGRLGYVPHMRFDICKFLVCAAVLVVSGSAWAQDVELHTQPAPAARTAEAGEFLSFTLASRVDTQRAFV